MGMLALAEQLNNVSAACRRAGISRSHYYEIKEAFEKFGAEGLAPQTKRRPRMPNQTPPELEAQILEMTERYPTYSYLRIRDQLKLVGIGVSPSTLRVVWQRHGLTLRIHLWAIVPDMPVYLVGLISLLVGAALAAMRSWHLPSEGRLQMEVIVFARPR
jgi:transposase